jgi:hypothetical protein
MLKDSELAGSLQSGPPEFVILAVTGAGQEPALKQGGVGTSVFRAFLLLAAPRRYLH